MFIYTSPREQSEKGPSIGGPSRKRPSVLSLTHLSLIDRFEIPDSARSLSSEPPHPKPSWARPLHLVRSPWILRLLRGDNTRSLNHPKQDPQFIAPVRIENLLHRLTIRLIPCINIFL